ncbi:MAG TPA: DUF929 family protein [Ktedonobacterales bacterium]|nr:DUF929 family protein [Ktedonobacterales bacterium]
MAAPRVFVSHSTADTEYCRAFVAALRETLGESAAVWFDENNLGTDELRQVIDRELQQRQHFIAILSPAALASEWVNYEIGAALSLLGAGNMRSIQFVIAAPCYVPPALERFRRIVRPDGLPFPPQDAARWAQINLLGTPDAPDATSAVPLAQSPYPAPVAQYPYPYAIPPAPYAPLPAAPSPAGMGVAPGISRQRSMWPMAAVIVTVVALIAIFFGIAHNIIPGASSGKSAAADNSPAAKIVRQMSTANPSIYAAVGTGTVSDPFKRVQGNLPVNKTADGKPIFLYVGADYCPFCAAERWSLVMALSRFGAFHNLALIQSSSTDVYPNTSTFSFHGASYTSQYLDFQGVETEDRDGNTLDTMTSDQQTIFQTYDAPPYIDTQYTGSIPFLSVGNQYIEISAGFIPDQMQGMTWQQIADTLNDPKSALAQSIIGNANYITAAICQVTGNKPANACASAPIPQIISDMKAGA